MQIRMRKGERLFAWSRNGFPIGIIKAETFLEACKKAVRHRMHEFGDSHSYAVRGVQEYDWIIELMPDNIIDCNPDSDFFQIPDRFKRAWSYDFQEIQETCDLTQEEEDAEELEDVEYED